MAQPLGKCTVTSHMQYTSPLAPAIGALYVIEETGCKIYMSQASAISTMCDTYYIKQALL